MVYFVLKYVREKFTEKFSHLPEDGPNPPVIKLT